MSSHGWFSSSDSVTRRRSALTSYSSLRQSGTLLDQIVPGTKLHKPLLYELSPKSLPLQVRSNLSSCETLDELTALAEDLLADDFIDMTNTLELFAIHPYPTEETSDALCKQIELPNSDVQQIRLLGPSTRPFPDRFSIPDTKFDHISIDELGSLRSFDGFTHVLPASIVLLNNRKPFLSGMIQQTA
ncbi:hypothetical protein D915_000592 [Fasciola hepatica]|uniref:Uncharacterized protein n=1 Tax=Fasciola hepatica TaxID=6192 RepID=A0A4E0RKZ9_FASHE|nr:hypothetical protein D915_000592 [Fasciola hepatica]